MSDLFSLNNQNKLKRAKPSYTAKDIEVLEGLEPVRKRPGMYIGGVDEIAMHHLISEVLDNAMDEVVAGHATKIIVELNKDNMVTISDNGRGIPVDKHPKFPKISALEVIFTTLHSGGKFSSEVYQTAGGLHGVGISVVNALSDYLCVKVYRDGKLFSQQYSKGLATTELISSANKKNLQGTIITFHPDPEIFGAKANFNPVFLYEVIKSKAYLHKGVDIEWKCDGSLINNKQIPEQAHIQFKGGLEDYLMSQVQLSDILNEAIFLGEVSLKAEKLKIEWATAWIDNSNNFVKSFCNTIPTKLGGTHEQGFKQGLLKSLKNYGEMTNNKKASNISIEDILDSAIIILSIFINEPLFQGQTKEKLVSIWVNKIIENIVKDHFDHWLSSNKIIAGDLLEYFINTADARINRKKEKNVSRKNITQKLRLPGKLADCRKATSEGTELFIVEGESAGGSAKQARDRDTQAVLPLRGKLLNVASSTLDKISQNQEIKDLEIALACRSLNDFNLDNLRYEKVIIMTDADVDGAHIASLLLTFFYIRMPKLILSGHLYLACPPLYRLTQNNKSYYAINDLQKNQLLKKLSTSKAKIDIGRFKGLGEMTPAQLKETTMCRNNRSILKVNIENLEDINKIVNDLMGKKAESRFEFIQNEAFNKIDKIINNLDI